MVDSDEILSRFMKVHRHRYDYTLVNYKGSKVKVKITCGEHGIFEQLPSSHIRGRGCPKCSNNDKKDIEWFIKKSKEVFGENTFDYSYSKYVNSETKIDIICREHGIFSQKSNSHFNGNGCPTCFIESRLDTTEEFISKANKAHNYKYDYSNTNYNGAFGKIEIICKKHGIFTQCANNHLNGNGCSECFIDYIRFDKKTYIDKSNEIHYFKYNYEHIDLISNKIKIECPKHGIFKQHKHKHLSGQGCPKCNSSKGENKVRIFLEKNNINYQMEKKFDKCEYRSKLRFDFYLPDSNMCIEYDGKHHFNKGYFSKDKYIKIRDIIKNEYCEKNGIKLLRIPYTKYDEIDDILNNVLNS